MTEESHIHDLLGVRRRSSNMQPDQQQDQHQHGDMQETAITPNNTQNSSQLMSTTGDVIESRDDDVVADRQCAAGLGVEVCRACYFYYILVYVASHRGVLEQSPAMASPALGHGTRAPSSSSNCLIQTLILDCIWFAMRQKSVQCIPHSC